ncbi:MAG TPA: hypothetical protein VJO35_07385 [Terriglobales bacterium]|nr:hypothetical protein [Terriglobales bacterium]
MNPNPRSGARKLSLGERAIITALAPGFKARLNDALVTEMQDDGMLSIRFVGANDRRRAGSLAEATYLDDDGMTVSIELKVDEAGMLFELDFWKVNFSKLCRYPSAQDLLPSNQSRPFGGGGKTRAEALQQMSPQIIAEVYLYPMAEGGRKSAAQPGWGCPCSSSKSEDAVFYDGWPLLNAPFAPGEHRRLGFVFLHGEFIAAKNIAAILRRVGTFYLWEGHFIGEAKVVP